MAPLGRSTCGAFLPLLFLVSVIVALPHVNAAAAVTTASCAVNADGSCLNTTVSFTGTDLDKVASVRIGLTPADEALIKCDTVKPSAKAVTCTLAVASSAKAGLYPATLALSDGTQVEAGSFLIGNTYEQKSLPRWTSTTKSSNYRVTGQSSDWPSTGDTWSVSGTFNPASTYSIVFYNNQKKAAIDSPGTPTCAPVKVTATTLTCTITSANGVMGMYNFLVRDSTNNALLLGSSSLPMLAVNPPLPEVTGASGDCAKNSASCVNGAALTISGINFNSRKAAYQQFFVGVNDAQRSAIQLVPATIENQKDVITELRIKGNVLAGSYPIFVKVQVCTSGMLSPLRFVGNLVLRGGSVPGFNRDEMNGAMTDGGKCPGWSNQTPAYKAAVAFAVIFALLFLGLLIALIVVCCRYTLIRKGRVVRDAFFDAPRSEMNADSTTQNYFNTAAPSRYDNDRA